MEQNTILVWPLLASVKCAEGYFDKSSRDSGGARC